MSGAHGRVSVKTFIGCGLSLSGEAVIPGPPSYILLISVPPKVERRPATVPMGAERKSTIMETVGVGGDTDTNALIPG